MRGVKGIVLHCSDSDLPEHDDISVIDEWHLERGWSGVGYHWFCNSLGDLQIGRQEYEEAAAAYGFNNGYVHICLSGRVNFNEDQFDSVVKLCKNIMAAYDLNLDQIYGHYMLNRHKTCPNFDIEEFKMRFQ
jgi:N-acetylmuramoyl-L-alanine amidase